MDKLLQWVVNHDEVSLLCCPSFLFANKLKKLGIDVDNINYDINFSDMPSVICKDFVFDDVDLNADLIVHKNIEKTYPIKFNPGTDVILIGDNDGHNGDCIPIMDADTIIRLYNIKKVYEKGCDEDETHYYVYGQV